jgi:thiamine-monophosphate kinase
LNEFELIRSYFAGQGLARDDVVVSIGDDAAVVAPTPGMQEVLTTDMLVAGRHFFADVDPRSIGHKALAVNLSDIAAMGATPAWFTLDLSLPSADPQWLRAFARGLFGLADQYRTQLVGGDTVRGPLAVAIQLCGMVPAGGALRRSGAQPGDRIYVTGTLGDAALALSHRRGALDLPEPERLQVVQRLEYPQPRVAAGEALRALASSCIDVSDGLYADLGHVLEASAVGAQLISEKIPLSPVYRRHSETVGGAELALSNGDDYELCFTVPPAKVPELQRMLSRCQCDVTYVGDIEAQPGLRMLDANGRIHEPKLQGYDHFGGG